MAGTRVCILLDLLPEPLWEVLSDYRRWRTWHQSIENSRMEDGISEGDCAPGAIIRVGDPDNPRVRIKWLGADEQRLEIAYTSIPPLPWNGRSYVARVRLVPLTESEQTVIEWTGLFDSEEFQEADTRNYLEGLYRDFIGWLADAARKVPPAEVKIGLEKPNEMRVH
jgi:Polyketide cyclase / dehydrase and lipid transport